MVETKQTYPMYTESICRVDCSTQLDTRLNAPLGRGAFGTRWENAERDTIVYRYFYIFI